jgi:hypothetical protein
LSPFFIKKGGGTSSLQLNEHQSCFFPKIFRIKKQNQSFNYYLNLLYSRHGEIIQHVLVVKYCGCNKYGIDIRDYRNILIIKIGRFFFSSPGQRSWAYAIAVVYPMLFTFKSTGTYLRKRRGHIFFEWNKCLCLNPLWNTDCPYACPTVRPSIQNYGQLNAYILVLVVKKVYFKSNLAQILTATAWQWVVQHIIWGELLVDVSC